MTEAIALVFEAPLRDIIEGLSPAEVASIRKAMTAAIDRGGDARDVKMPVHCTLEQMPASVVVTPEEVGGAPWVRVTAGPVAG